MIQTVFIKTIRSIALGQEQLTTEPVKLKIGY